MTVVSSKEFVSNEDKYFDLALDEQVFVQRGDNMFLIINHNHNGNIYHDASVYDEVLEPDDDFHSAISADEFKKRALEIVEKVHNMYYPR